MSELNPDRRILLQKAADAEFGGDVEAMLEDGAISGTAVAICTSCEEVYGERLEPDAEDCECEECETPTVQSVLIIAGVI
jgi:hypothetical protein